jgi:hypothetical protein
MSSRKYRPITSGFAEASREQEVRREIDNFLRALNSYPERFVHNPCLSFEQYLCKIMAYEHAPDDGPHRVN